MTMTVSNSSTSQPGPTIPIRRQRYLRSGGRRRRRSSNININSNNNRNSSSMMGMTMKTLSFIVFSLALLVLVMMPMSSLLLSSSSSSSSSLSSSIANAKEIVATNEWQVIEEGDTIPAGLHVRMDMTTGLKMAKLIDPDDDNQQQQQQQQHLYQNEHEHEHTQNRQVDVVVKQGQEGASSVDISSTALMVNTVEEGKDASETKDDVKITHLTNTKLNPDASAKITNQLLKQAQREQEQAQEKEQQRRDNLEKSISSLNDFEGDMSADESDYETMYRALMSLPEEDRLQLNIPEFPESKSEEDLEPFIKQITEIWNDRQRLLKELEDEYMANIPDIIHSRISSIKEYISSPLELLKNAIGDDNGNDNSNGNNDDHTSMNIMDVLEDLEFHLMDIDMARDFHTMGGWPLLVSLLTDNIHGLDGAVRDIIIAQNQTDATMPLPIIPDDQQLYIQHLREASWKVQTLASWCIGTAVKNVEEFHTWALEDLSDLLDQTARMTEESKGMSVISILLNRLKVTDGDSIDPWLLDSSPWLKMKQKELYALGALLRGNKNAIYYFNSINGPSTLSHFFQTLIPTNDMSGSLVLNNIAGVKLLSRIMMLGADLLADISSIQKNSGELVDGIVLQSLTTQEWCSMPMRILPYSSTNIQRQTIEVMAKMATHCDFTNDIVKVNTIVDDPEIKDLLNTIQVKAV